MSNLEPHPDEAVSGGRATVDERPVHEALYGREVVLGTRGLRVTRTLPHRDRRMVGAWCFVDQYGPEDIGAGPGMRVPPHPHTGLQTVSWLVSGEVFHRDSIGNRQEVRPGTLGLMTAGRGIAHAEETPPVHSPILHGVQLWVALPSDARQVKPHFEHHADLPRADLPGADGVTVILGDLAGAVSPATTYSPIVGAEIVLDHRLELPLRPDFEYAVLGLSGTARVDGVPLPQGPLLYLGCGRTTLDLAGDPAGRVLLLGGEPFDEKIVMWWNFVARSHEEIVRYRDEWDSGTAFGVVAGTPLPAPPLPTTPLRPRGRTRDA